MQKLKLEELKKITWNLSGIYIITCVVSNHSYIGQAKDIRKRLREHLSSMKRYINTGIDDGKDNYCLLQAYKKYDNENFYFDILELCDKDKLDDREIYWISYYNTYHNGYNMTLGGGQNTSSSAEWTEKMRKKSSDLKNPKPVYQISFNGEIINEFWSIGHASKELNIDSRGIYSCCNKGISKSSQGYIWCYKEDYDSGNFDIEYYLNKKQKKPIEQYDMYGNLIKIWNNGCEVLQDGFSQSKINSCCNHKAMSAYGFIWKFQDDNTRVIDEIYCEEARRKLETVKVRKVIQLDLKNNIRKLYDSIRATKQDGFLPSQVSLCCRHQKETYKGYKWLFEEEYTQYSSFLFD